MAVLAHPASVDYFDRLLYQEIKITHDLLVSLMPLLQNLVVFSEEIRIANIDGVEFTIDWIKTLNASFDKLSETLDERSQRINYYKQMGSFSGTNQ